MPLPPGTRIGPHEVAAALGSGGMGVVYRARDTKLCRTVAIKALPGLLAGDPQHVARFAREAQLLATLNHPHIAGIYGLEEDQGARFLILEYIDGQSLAERLPAGALPLSEAPRIFFECGSRLVSGVHPAMARVIGRRQHAGVEPARGRPVLPQRVRPTVFRVDVRCSPTVSLGPPRAITRPSTLLARTGFDVSLDGTKLLMVQDVKADESKDRRSRWCTTGRR